MIIPTENLVASTLTVGLGNEIDLNAGVCT